MVGTGRGARLGILVKSGAALQTAGDVRVVVCDKTGTLTHGKPALTDSVPSAGTDADTLLALAGAAEARSEHPLAKAIAAAAAEKGAPLPAPEHFEAVPGRGVTARIGGHDVLVGTAAFLAETGVPADGPAAMVVDKDVSGPDGALLAPRGVPLSEEHIRAMHSLTRSCDLG